MYTQNGQSYAAQICASGTGNVANPTPGSGPGYVELGPNGETLGVVDIDCTAASGGAAAQAAPPPPPTQQEVLQTDTSWEPLESSGIQVNPGTLGLTGLACWFWLANGQTALPTISAAVGGYSVSASMSISSYTWVFGDGDTATAYAPGNESDPAVTYTYQSKGLYTVSVIAHYVGSYTYVNAAGVAVTEPLAVDVTMGTLSYGVQEARSVLVDPDGQGG